MSPIRALARRCELVFGLAASGALTVPQGGRYSLEQAAEAHRALEGGRTAGKIVPTPIG
ncbi:MAG TPA: zinc-binding dehydrogenase [Gemmatimonadaceae bacterium]